MTTRLLVYGSLRRGERANALLATATFVRLARTVPHFTLYDLGGFPGLVRVGDVAVLGEVYDVDADTLARLDRYESHPHFYLREAIELEDGERVETYLLHERHAKGRPIVRAADWCARNREMPCGS